MDESYRFVTFTWSQTVPDEEWPVPRRPAPTPEPLFEDDYDNDQGDYHQFMTVLCIWAAYLILTGAWANIKPWLLQSYENSIAPRISEISALALAAYEDPATILRDTPAQKISDQFWAAVAFFQRTARSACGMTVALSRPVLRPILPVFACYVRLMNGIQAVLEYIVHEYQLEGDDSPRKVADVAGLPPGRRLHACDQCQHPRPDNPGFQVPDLDDDSDSDSDGGGGDGAGGHHEDAADQAGQPQAGPHQPRHCMKPLGHEAHDAEVVREILAQDTAFERDLIRQLREMTEHAQKVTELNADLLHLREELEQALGQQQEEFHGEINLQAARVQELLNQVNDLTQREQNQISHNQALQGRAGELFEEVTELRERAGELTENIERLQGWLDERTEASQELEGRVEALRAENETLGERVDGLRTENADLTNQLDYFRIG
ncbi:hypothetical protein ACRE_052350 [Hapsidospora chrysogenum ATCC 11550]|uniref:Uncharacterized protein n=1 Tax=Hapsidospora chrysogenum (strain ATCC 11550 / CBS 779.69 / DSM 880 / IAM 14645 / JCM 23072 / IMI 49137) TaxID=857340 RepID=A0A086T3R2_HAPC1|nr:hypothetical protein ACRE_052350 [Hapsidospora chrysogenum ATCC 11550]